MNELTTWTMIKPKGGEFEDIKKDYYEPLAQGIIDKLPLPWLIRFQRRASDWLRNLEGSDPARLSTGPYSLPASLSEKGDGSVEEHYSHIFSFKEWGGNPTEETLPAPPDPENNTLFEAKRKRDPKKEVELIESHLRHLGADRAQVFLWAVARVPEDVPREFYKNLYYLHPKGGVVANPTVTDIDLRFLHVKGAKPVLEVKFTDVEGEHVFLVTEENTKPDSLMRFMTSNILGWATAKILNGDRRPHPHQKEQNVELRKTHGIQENLAADLRRSFDPLPYAALTRPILNFSSEFLRILLEPKFRGTIEKPTKEGGNVSLLAFIQDYQVTFATRGIRSIPWEGLERKGLYYGPMDGLDDRYPGR